MIAGTNFYIFDLHYIAGEEVDTTHMTDEDIDRLLNSGLLIDDMEHDNGQSEGIE